MLEAVKKPTQVVDKHRIELPDIPSKLYFAIGEVSQLCDLKPHVLRYWEQEFTQLKPCKRRGNRRYYQRKDVILIRRIRDLLYNQGYTIEGARSRLSVEFNSQPNKQDTTTINQQTIQETIRSLEVLLSELEA